MGHVIPAGKISHTEQTLQGMVNAEGELLNLKILFIAKINDVEKKILLTTGARTRERKAAEHENQCTVQTGVDFDEGGGGCRLVWNWRYRTDEVSGNVS